MLTPFSGGKTALGALAAVVTPSRLREIWVGVHFRERNRKTGGRSKVTLGRLIEWAARRAHERRRRRISIQVSSVLRLEPEVACALIHELGQDRGGTRPGERCLASGGASRGDERQSRSLVARLQLRFRDDIARLETGGDADGRRPAWVLEVLVIAELRVLRVPSGIAPRD